MQPTSDAISQAKNRGLQLRLQPRSQDVEAHAVRSQDVEAHAAQVRSMLNAYEGLTPSPRDERLDWLEVQQATPIASTSHSRMASTSTVIGLELSPRSRRHSMLLPIDDDAISASSSETRHGRRRTHSLLGASSQWVG